MNFSALLHYAKQKSDEATKEESRFYSTKYAPPKKETKESKQLSTNIQKFLKKREEEEAARKREEREKLSNLLALRDEKSKNKIRKMLKVTKSANKSVLDEANDASNTVDQSEGDDYGYVSTEANAFYQKYIEKVKDVKDDKGFAPSRPQSLRDLSGTKERVKAAITREREEAKSHTRQRISNVTTRTEPIVARAHSTSSKSVSDQTAERRDEEERKKEEQKKAKAKRPPQPPPIDFQSLLRLAEKKQHEPVNFAVPEKKKEPERLLSAREKRELEERQRWKEQRAERDRKREADVKSKDQRKEIAAGQPSRQEPIGRIPKLNKPPVKATATTAATESKAKPSDSLKRPASTPASSSSAKVRAISKPTSMQSNGNRAGGRNGNAAAVNTKRPVAHGTTKPATTEVSASSSKSNAKVPSRNPYAGIKPGTTREFPPRDPGKTREFPPRDPGKTRAFPPADVQRSGRKDNGASASGRKDNVASASGRGGKAAPSQKYSQPRRIYDEESEYDSELDDFIDDGDCEEDISSHIRNIFGYDKRRYKDVDEDDARMESSYAEVQREEFISKKLGIQEDLEDMRMEAMLKKRKIAKKRSKRLDDDDE